MANVNDLVASEGKYHLKCKNRKVRAKRLKPKGKNYKASAKRLKQKGESYKARAKRPRLQSMAGAHSIYFLCHDFAHLNDY